MTTGKSVLTFHNVVLLAFYKNGKRLVSIINVLEVIMRK